METRKRRARTFSLSVSVSSEISEFPGYPSTLPEFHGNPEATGAYIYPVCFGKFRDLRISWVSLSGYPDGRACGFFGRFQVWMCCFMAKYPPPVATAPTDMSGMDFWLWGGSGNPHYADVTSAETPLRIPHEPR